MDLSGVVPTVGSGETEEMSGSDVDPWSEEIGEHSNKFTTPIINDVDTEVKADTEASVQSEESKSMTQSTSKYRTR